MIHTSEKEDSYMKTSTNLIIGVIGVAVIAVAW